MGEVKRTVPQNRSLHKYLSQIAEDMADAGYDMKTVISVPITPTMESVKKYMFKVIMTAMYPDKVSTSELTTIELQNVYRQFDLILSERFGISRPWPSQESIGES